MKKALILLLAALSLTLCACSNNKYKLVRYTPEPDDVTIIALEDILDDSKTVIDCSLLLINGEHGVAKDAEFEIDEYINAAGEATDVYMNKIIMTSYAELSAALKKKFNNKLYISDAYRSYDDQVAAYDEYGSATAARPGYSEHQAGLALDVYVAYYAGEGFVNCKEGRWVNRNCGQYGFIIRYPKGKEGETGFAYEPWHLRYVGQPHARIISDGNYTLESYLDMLEKAEYYRCGDYTVMKVSADSEYVLALAPNGYTSLNISDTGCGYYIFTFYTEK